MWPVFGNSELVHCLSFLTGGLAKARPGLTSPISQAGRVQAHRLPSHLPFTASLFSGSALAQPEPFPWVTLCRIQGHQRGKRQEAVTRAFGSPSLKESGSDKMAHLPSLPHSNQRIWEWGGGTPCLWHNEPRGPPSNLTSLTAHKCQEFSTTSNVSANCQPGRGWQTHDPHHLWALATAVRQNGSPEAVRPHCACWRPDRNNGHLPPPTALAAWPWALLACRAWPDRCRDRHSLPGPP